MVDNATIEIELDGQTVWWDEFTSSKVELCGFEWFVSGTYNHQNGFEIHRTVIHCAPVSGKETSTWSCEAKVKFVAFAQDKEGDEVTYSKNLSHCFNFREPESAPISFNFGEQFANEMNFLRGNDCKLELRLNVIEYKQVDYGRPYNAMIKCPDDSVQVVVDGKTLFLSKEVFGSASPIFKALFTNDSEEKRSGKFEVKEIELEEFMWYIRIIYGVHVDIDNSSLYCLLYFEDKYQCDAVRSMCNAFLVATNTLTHLETLCLGDRFRFDDVVNMAIEKIDVQELMIIGLQMETETFSHKTTLKILKAVFRRQLKL